MFLRIFNAELHQEKYWQTEVSGGGRRWSLFLVLYYHHQNYYFALRVCVCVCVHVQIYVCMCVGICAGIDEKDIE